MSDMPENHLNESSTHKVGDKPKSSLAVSTSVLFVVLLCNTLALIVLLFHIHFMRSELADVIIKHNALSNKTITVKQLPMEDSCSTIQNFKQAPGVESYKNAQDSKQMPDKAQIAPNQPINHNVVTLNDRLSLAGCSAVEG